MGKHGGGWRQVDVDLAPVCLVGKQAMIKIIALARLQLLSADKNSHPAHSAKMGTADYCQRATLTMPLTSISVFIQVLVEGPDYCRSVITSQLVHSIPKQSAAMQVVSMAVILANTVILLISLSSRLSFRLVVADGFSSEDYLEALQKCILFYEGQRSGRLPSNQRVTWRGDSGLEDGGSDNVDLVGGYYDAGDNVKFGLPMAFTITLLSWSVIDFEADLSESGELANAQEAIRWGTDYILKAHCAPEELYIQVGNPGLDHACWERPEDMDTDRTAYKVDAQHPGSDIAAESAAALAAASSVFQVLDPDYSSDLLRHAQQLFTFADSHRGSYSDQHRDVVCPYYCSVSGYEDELLWGAAWLYRATGNSTYLQYLADHEGELKGTQYTPAALSWDNKYHGAQILLSIMYYQNRDSYLEAFTEQAQHLLCSLIPNTGYSDTVTFSPGGLLYQAAQCNMQYVTSTAFLLTTYQKHLGQAGIGSLECNGNAFSVTSEQMLEVAKKQVDYILGQNPRGISYMVGFGPSYPQQVHHRAASVPSMEAHPQKVDCHDGFTWYYSSSSPNPNVLIGAVVGGPDQQDNFDDHRSNYNQLEPATYVNSGLVGVLAYLATDRY